jgi:hypothetical protein
LQCNKLDGSLNYPDRVRCKIVASFEFFGQ